MGKINMSNEEIINTLNVEPKTIEEKAEVTRRMFLLFEHLNNEIHNNVNSIIMSDNSVKNRAKCIACNILGQLKFEIGDYDSALKYFNDAIEYAIDNNDMFGLYMNKAQVLKFKGKLREAIKYIDKAIYIYDRNVQSYMIKAEILEKLGDNEKADKCRCKAIKLKN